jgi:hypothetical protein
MVSETELIKYYPYSQLEAGEKSDGKKCSECGY